MAPHLGDERACRGASGRPAGSADQHPGDQRPAARRSISTMPCGARAVVDHLGGARPQAHRPYRRPGREHRRARTRPRPCRRRGPRTRRSTARSSRAISSEESGRGRDRGAANGRAPLRAVFAANDNMAIGALQALARAGLRVPEDVAVAGFDDIPLARHLGLTTVRVRIAELGERAIAAPGRTSSSGETARRRTSRARAGGARFNHGDRRADDRARPPSAARRQPRCFWRAGLSWCAPPAGCRSTRFRRFLRGDRAAHLPLVLGDGEPQEWAGARSLADAELLEHRRGRLCAPRLCRSASSAAGARAPKRAT